MTDQLLMAARRSDCAERLLSAVKNTQSDVVQALIEAGISVNESNEYGFTPLHESRDERIIRMLVEAGAEINVRNNIGWTPLHYILQHGHVDIACYLISKGADPFVFNNAGKTPIDLASPKITKNMLIAVLKGLSKEKQQQEQRLVNETETNRSNNYNSTSESLQRISAVLEQQAAGMQQQNLLLSIVVKALLNQCSRSSQPETVPDDNFQPSKRLRHN